MFRWFFQDNPAVGWHLAGMGIFMAVFVLVVLYVLVVMRGRADLDRLSALPLADDTSAVDREFEEDGHE